MRLASIDIGTNSTRFLVAEVHGTKLSTMHSGLITTRLGQGINRGQLLPEAMERTVVALEQFLYEIAPFKPERIIAAATSAVRDARNRDEFLRFAAERTGLRVRVLSGEEEAAASYRGVLGGLPVVAQDTLVLDVGGGSTEIIWPVNKSVRFVSLPLGAVRMTEAGKTEAEIKELLTETLEQVTEQAGLGKSLVAVGGTATTLAAIALRLQRYRPELVHGHFLTIDQVREILKMLREAGAEGRKKIIGLQPQRADIIVAGVSILSVVLETLCLKGLTVSETDILHGLILE